MARMLQYRGVVYRPAGQTPEDILLLWWRYWLGSTPGGAPEANAEWLLESVQHESVAADALDKLRDEKGLEYCVGLAESVLAFGG